jgi:hypothetical protein
MLTKRDALELRRLRSLGAEAFLDRTPQRRKILLEFRDGRPARPSRATIFSNSFPGTLGVRRVNVPIEQLGFDGHDSGNFDVLDHASLAKTIAANNAGQTIVNVLERPRPPSQRFDFGSPGFSLELDSSSAASTRLLSSNGNLRATCRMPGLTRLHRRILVGAMPVEKLLARESQSARVEEVARNPDGRAQPGAISF